MKTNKKNDLKENKKFIDNSLISIGIRIEGKDETNRWWKEK